MQAGILQHSLAARHSHPVIGVEKDNRVFGETVGGELIEKFADLPIHQRNAVEIARPRPPRLIGVGIKSRQRDARRVAPFAGRKLRTDFFLKLFRRPHARARLVGGHKIEHREKWLPVAPPAPVRLG